jgi:hypothetical protein
MQALQLRSLANGTSGRIWSATYHKYLVEEWDPSSGVRYRAFERVAEWFTPWLFGTSVDFQTPPQPKLMGVFQDDGGLLWTVTLVAGESWKDGLYRDPEWDNEIVVFDTELLYDSYIEAIDPATGRLLVSEKIPQSTAGFTNDGLLIGLRDPADDVPQIELWRPQLAGR